VDYWTTGDVAAEADVNASRIRQLCLEGRFPNAVKRGRDWLIPDDDVQRWLSEDRDRRFAHYRKKDR